MEITPKNLNAFRQWLLNRGRSEGTADLYVSNLKKCAEEPTVTKRLVSGGLAPLTRRTNKAALVQWAKFTKQPDLAEAVSEIKLPPARRVAIKVPLAVVDWQALVRALATSKLDDRVRCTCLVIAKRGIRVSDALRIKRTEVTTALKSGVLSYVGKGDKRHEISARPVLAELETLAAMKGWDRISDLISVGKNRATAPKRIRRAFKIIAKKLEIEGVHPHRFRRTYATNYLEEHKGDPRAIIKLQHHMGWASMATAALYADAVDRDELAEAGERMTDRLFAKAD